MHSERDYFSQDRSKIDPIGIEVTVWSNYDQLGYSNTGPYPPGCIVDNKEDGLSTYYENIQMLTFCCRLLY